MRFTRMLLLGLLVFATYKGWTNYQHKRLVEQRLIDAVASNRDLRSVDEALKQQQPYVAVYGRDQCGYTSRLRAQLDRAGVPYHYFNVDDKNAAFYLHQRMAVHQLETSSYELPVVDRGDQMAIRPDPATLIAQPH